MQALTGLIDRCGPMIYVKVMQTNQRVEALKRAGQSFSSPLTVLGLIDTGASISALDKTVVSALGLAARGQISLHTPTTGVAYEKRWCYDALFIVGESSAHPLSRAIQVIESSFASEGFLR